MCTPVHRFVDRQHRSRVSLPQRLNGILLNHCPPVHRSHFVTRPQSAHSSRHAMESRRQYGYTPESTNTGAVRLYALPTCWMSHHPIGSGVHLANLKVSSHTSRPLQTKEDTASRLLNLETPLQLALRLAERTNNFKVCIHAAHTHTGLTSYLWQTKSLWKQ
ncbi:hypothetical protein M3J09_011973 [Ascochyta lentis]